ncbi:MAG: hypothetical protein KDD89_15840, partial [Anaerolineales bacterium]|nr:hypothetical protein [Anaerolineales bacterium]
MQLPGRPLAALRELLSGDDISFNELKNLVFDEFSGLTSHLDHHHKDDYVRALLSQVNGRREMNKLLHWLGGKRRELINELEAKIPAQDWRPMPLQPENEPLPRPSTPSPPNTQTIPIAVLA